MKYRAPRAKDGQKFRLERAMDMVADRVWESRKRTFVHKQNGATINHTTAICHLGGATLDNEENYLIRKLFTLAWGWSAYPTRRGYDIAARCPVWVPPSGGAELRPRNKISRMPIAF